MISGPIVALVITKVNLDITNAKCHHENNQTFEQRFQKNVTDLVEEFLTQSNPFEERDDILYTVVSKVMMIQEVKDSVQRASIIGENQYKKLLSEVIEFKRKTIHDVITKNNLPIFKKKNSRYLCKSKQEVLSLNKIVSYIQVFMWHVRLVKVIYGTFFLMKIIHTHQLCQNLGN